MPNPRWHRLTAGFREVGALLVLAAPAAAPHIEDLVRATDGAILVGDGVPSKVPVVRVISSVRETPAKGFDMPDASSGRRSAAEHETHRDRRWTVAHVRRRWPSRAGSPRGRSPRASVNEFAPRQHERRTDRCPGRAAGHGRRCVREAAVMPLTSVLVENPEDSATAAAYAIELMAANTQYGAILKLQQDGKNLPAATYSPVLDAQGAQWFKVISGASVQRVSGVAARDAAQQKVIDSTSGSVVRLPFAFLIDSNLPPAAVPELIGINRDRGIPAYALKQDNGTAWLLVGAFESVEQSQLVCVNASRRARVRCSCIAPGEPSSAVDQARAAGIQVVRRSHRSSSSSPA